MKNKKLTAYEKIVEAQKEREMVVLGWVRAGEREGRLYRTNFIGFTSSVTYNAIDRLVAAGKIRYSKKRMGYYIPKSYKTK